MVLDFGLVKDRSETGTYAWMILSSFFLSRAFSSIIYGFVIDKYGRKPALMVCMISMALFSLMLGFSKSIMMAAIARFLLGLFSATPVVAKTIIGEI
jgi:MFS family permease